MEKDDAHCYVFILSNVCLYLFGIIYNIIALIFSRYYKFFIKGAYLLQLFLVSYSVYGLVILRKMYDLQMKDHTYHNLWKLFVWMICVRLMIYMIICSFMICMTFIIVVAIVTGQT